VGSAQEPPSKEVVNIIVESSNGDIRSAVMALQFACVIEMGNKDRKKKSGEKAATVVLESVTRREQSLVLFHLMGKVLYNKRIFSSAGMSFFMLINRESRER
jgi:cell cycle checkpoint protein